MLIHPAADPTPGQVLRALQGMTPAQRLELAFLAVDALWNAPDSGALRAVLIPARPIVHPPGRSVFDDAPRPDPTRP